MSSRSTSGSALGLMIETRRTKGNLMTNCIPFEPPLGRPIEEVYDGVHDGEVLGSGISGVVREVTHKASGHKYAVKCLDLSLIQSAKQLEQLRQEIYIMCQLDHPNIIRLEEVYESHNEIFLVQEYCKGGDLFDRLNDQHPHYHYSEIQCAKLVSVILCSVRYLHSKGIIHRDLKLENFLFSSKSPDSELKLIDFGLSKHFKFGEIQHESVGTPYTVAPEVILGNYDARCDIWGIGVITFLLLSGYPPFGGCAGSSESLMPVRNNILSGSFRFEPSHIWANVSDLAKNFIKSLLTTNPNLRPTAEGAQQLPWIKEFSQRHNPSSNNLNPNVVRSLVAFKEYSDMKKLLCEVLSFTLLPEQIQNLREEFEVLDKEGTGEISLQSLKSALMSSALNGNLGALSESEIGDIFDAMRVRESETTLHWHEFIAACLSQCQVDDRNLKIAFDRMDTDHNGYITFKNVLNLLGSDGASEERVRRLYFDGMSDLQIDNLHITYDHFLAVMKGQSTAELNQMLSQEPRPSIKLGISESLNAVQESTNTTSPDLFKAHPIEEIPSTETWLSDLTSVNIIPSPSLGEFETIIPSVRHILNLPTQNKDNKNNNRLSRDESTTALVVNRSLYRAHREMRQAVLDASKRLEEYQLRRVLEEEKQKQYTGKSDYIRPLQSAGLVMMRGQKKQMSTEQVRIILEERVREQQEKLAIASKQAGRGRPKRKKTVSDMTGMLGTTKVTEKANPPQLLSSLGSCPPSPAVRSGIPIEMGDDKSPIETIPFMPTLQLLNEN